MLDIKVVCINSSLARVRQTLCTKVAPLSGQGFPKTWYMRASRLEWIASEAQLACCSVAIALTRGRIMTGREYA